MDLNDKIAARRREIAADAEKAKQEEQNIIAARRREKNAEAEKAKQEEQAKELIRQKELKIESERAKQAKHNDAITRLSELLASNHIHGNAVDTEVQKVLNKVASDRMTNAENLVVSILFMLGIVSLFFSWWLGICFIICSLIFLLIRRSQYKNKFAAEAKIAIEEINKTSINADRLITGIREQLADQFGANYSKRNIKLAILVIVIIVIKLTMIYVNDINSKELLKLNNARIDEFNSKNGYTKIDKQLFIEDNSIKETKQETFKVKTVSTHTSNVLNNELNKFVYTKYEELEIDCMNKIFKILSSYNVTEAKYKNYLDQIRNSGQTEKWFAPDKNINKNYSDIVDSVCSSKNKFFSAYSTNYRLTNILFSNYSSVNRNKNSGNDIISLGVYTLDKTKKRDDFASVVSSAFNLSELNDIKQRYINAKQNVDHKFKKIVDGYAEKNLATKQITLRLEASKDYEAKYINNFFKLRLIDRKSMSSNGLPIDKLVYNNTIIDGNSVFEVENSLSSSPFNKRSLNFSSQFASDIVKDGIIPMLYESFNKSELLVTFELGAKIAETGVKTDTFTVLPSLKVIKCDWVVGNKILWSFVKQ